MAAGPLAADDYLARLPLDLTLARKLDHSAAKAQKPFRHRPRQKQVGEPADWADKLLFASTELERDGSSAGQAQGATKQSGANGTLLQLSQPAMIEADKELAHARHHHQPQPQSSKLASGGDGSGSLIMDEPPSARIRPAVEQPGAGAGGGRNLHAAPMQAPPLSERRQPQPAELQVADLPKDAADGNEPTIVSEGEIAEQIRRQVELQLSENTELGRNLKRQFSEYFGQPVVLQAVSATKDSGAKTSLVHAKSGRN